MSLREKVQEAADRIRTSISETPDIAIVLGTGLGSLVEDIRNPRKIPYDSIPYFARTTVETHKGDLVFGRLEGKSVVAMEGRFHCYEGYTPEQVTFPIRLLRKLGGKILIVSNACGGLNPRYEKGDLVAIDDHINWMGVNPLVGPNDEFLGPRFPDMSRPYDVGLMDLAERAARGLGIRFHRGVYLALLGPNLETRAEYRMLRTLGADMVGMSTVPEVLVGIHMGFRILGLSIVTDLCNPDALEPARLEDIIAVAQGAEPKMRAVIRHVVAQAEV